ncbi:hypothetical protein ACEWKJ_40510, partial [Streptomyces chrestomyceticus]
PSVRPQQATPSGAAPRPPSDRHSAPAGLWMSAFLDGASDGESGGNTGASPAETPARRPRSPGDEEPEQ